MQLIPKKESALSDLEKYLTKELAYFNNEVERLTNELENASREVYKFKNMLNEVNLIIKEDIERKMEEKINLYSNQLAPN